MSISTSIQKLGICTAMLLSTFYISTTDSEAKTLRRAPIYIENRTGGELEYVALVHKYSDVYKDKETFANIANGVRSNDYLIARYNTGFGTTGKDWWQVSWKKKGDNRVYYTNPNNFRGIFDAVENLAKKTSAKLATDEITALFFNSEGTKGFKQHILRSKDENRPTIIAIYNHTVELKSPSGRSSTEGIEFKQLNDVSTAGLTCQSKLKTIAFDYKGSKNWSDANLNNLCGPAVNLEPAHCFETVMHKGFDYGGGNTNWGWVNASNLCRKTLDASRTLDCFKTTMPSAG